VNDWATKEIVKQFTKNKQRNHYQNGWLDVPVKYAYLKNNASMCNPTVSRKKTALSAGSTIKKTATRKDVQGEKEHHENSEGDDGEDSTPPGGQ
jgi:hypothetical protein